MSSARSAVESSRTGGDDIAAARVRGRSARRPIHPRARNRQLCDWTIGKDRPSELPAPEPGPGLLREERLRAGDDGLVAGGEGGFDEPSFADGGVERDLPAGEPPLRRPDVRPRV